MGIMKMSTWFDGNCTVKFSGTQIIRLNHLGKKGIFIDSDFEPRSISLYFKNILFLQLTFHEDYNLLNPIVQLNLPSITRSIDSIHLMKDTKYGLSNEYHTLIQRYCSIDNNDPGTCMISLEDLEYHIDFFINRLSSLVAPGFNFESYGQDEIRMNQKILSDNHNRITGVDAEYKVTRRIGNMVFYFGVLEIHDKKCMICGTFNESLVDVCHIKPWSESINEKHERTDKFNGLTLCKNHHHLFDTGYFTIDKNNNVVLSEKIDKLDREMFFNPYQRRVSLCLESQYYLKWHRENAFISIT